jgi:hypothetical protein
MLVYPISYWFVIGMIITGVVLSVQRIKDGTGIPMLAVIGTVTVWYVGDAYYNDYAHSYALIFDSDVLAAAWWQVGWFFVVFFVAVPPIHQWFNARHLRYQSGVFQLARRGVDYPALQKQLNILFGGCLIIYVILVSIATIRLGSEIQYFFFPFLGYKAEPWGRQRIGTHFDALLSFALYIQMMVTTVFGVVAAVSTNRRTRLLAMILCFVSWPYFLFDRTRNTILAVVVPAMVSWVFLRLRGSILKKAIVLGTCYIVINAWMAFIIENRSSESIATAFREQGFSIEKESEVHHQGLNMFEELCWINTFIKKGTYEPNWGTRYFAELVNPIPRSLWHGKPLIGIDYAIARGQGQREGSGGGGGVDQGSVYATVSTGMIGQGEVNFGTLLGPAAAALLMSLWVAVLARQDLHIMQLGRLPLYACGLILTFNLGRDITFITLYPFVFGAAALWWLERHKRPVESGQAQTGLASPPLHNAGQPVQQSRQPVSRPSGKSIQMQVPRRKMITRSRPPRPRISGNPGGFRPLR